jgi:hypothetical protein
VPPSLTSRLTNVPYAALQWANAIRIIPGQYPPIIGFEQIAAPSELEALLALERETQPSNVTPSSPHITLSSRAKGAGAGFVMPAFTRVSLTGTRFASPGSYGVYYAGRDEDTAITETVFHTEQEAGYTQRPDQLFMRRVLVADIEASVPDFRGAQKGFGDMYDPVDYSVGQAIGRHYHNEQADGIVYDSVRHTGGECVAVFNPSCIHRCRHTKFLAYHWDGRKVVAVYDMKQLRIP